MSPGETVTLAVIVPSAGAALIGMSRASPNQREGVTLVTASVLLGLVASLLPGVLAGERPGAVLAQTLPGLPIALEVEPLGMLFALLASTLWLVTSVYSIGYMRAHREAHQTRFYACFAVALTGAIGVAFAANMFTLFLFYEVLTFSTYPLVTHSGTEEARRAGRTYLGVLVGTSVGLLLLAVVWTWTLAGTLDFREGGILAGTASPAVLGALFALYVFGIGKAAVMPFHRWLPAAMVAPAPVSALLHAVAVVKAGVFSILKVTVYLFGPVLAGGPGGSGGSGGQGVSGWLVYVAGATIVLASLVALREDNLKRRLAYSTISQLSYVVLGAMLANAAGIVGGAMHMVTHAFAKITLFFCAGAIAVTSGRTEVSQLAGIGRRMPWTMGAFAVAALSMVGVPPTGGFIGKWYLALGAVEARQGFALGALLASTILNAAYLLPVVYTAFFREPASGAAGPGVATEHGEAPLPVLAALTVTAAATLVLFAYPDLPLALARQLAGAGR